MVYGIMREIPAKITTGLLDRKGESLSKRGKYKRELFFIKCSSI